MLPLFLTHGMRGRPRRTTTRRSRTSREAIRLDPKYLESLLSRGTVWLDKRDCDKAIQGFHRGHPPRPEVRRTRSCTAEMAWVPRGESTRRSRISTRPSGSTRSGPSRTNGLAWLLAACPEGKYRDGKRAVELATKACELSGWRYNYHYRHSRGCITPRQGLSRRRSSTRNRRARRQGLEKQYGQSRSARLKLYPQQTPYRLPPPMKK